MVSCDFAKYEIGRNKILILRNDLAEISSCFSFAKEISSKTYFAKWFRRNFAEHFLYFAKFRCVISFAKEISVNFVKYLLHLMILPKFREILFEFREISLCSFCERNFAKFRQIFISRNDFAEISRNFANYFSYFAKLVAKLVSRNEISRNLASRNFAKFRKIISKISQITKWRFREISFREAFVATLVETTDETFSVLVPLERRAWINISNWIWILRGKNGSMTLQRR